MDSDSDFGFGGNGDDDASFTLSLEEEQQQQDKNIVPATVTPTTQKRNGADSVYKRSFAFCGMCDDASTMVRLKPLHVVP